MSELVPAHPAHQVLVPHVDNIKALMITAVDYAGNTAIFAAGKYEPASRCHRCGYDATTYYCGACFAEKRHEERVDWFGRLGATRSHQPEGDRWKAVLWVGFVVGFVAVALAVWWWLP